MTHLELLDYLEDKIGVKLQLMFRKFEGPFLPESVYMGIKKDRLKDIRGYVQPREEDSLNEMEIIYFMNISKVNLLRHLTEKYIGLNNNWKHPEIIYCDISTTLQKSHKPVDIAYQIVKIKFSNEAHTKDTFINEINKIGNITIKDEREFNYHSDLDDHVVGDFMVLIQENESENNLSLRFISKKSTNIFDAIGYFEKSVQHVIRRNQNVSRNEIDFDEFQALDYSYKLI